ncbi:MAG: hydroxyphenylacetyl-CoA thioesterase PaaI [Alphaproteobacteria bacterium]|nr:hydroxyphenylacetyl-CoA thioesterase PaaI [Alphaproteobacteria bacterium]
MTPQAIAEAAAQAMWAADRASQALGMELVSVGPGRATLRMTVRPDMCNGYHLCHGGMIFSLADSAFAFACNSHNKVTVANNCSVAFLTSARTGDVLTAEAIERHRGGRSGVYDVTVTDQAGRTIAVFRGHSTQIKGELVPGLTAES